MNDSLTSMQSHSKNDRLEDKMTRLERLVEEQRAQIVQLEANPRMTKAELNTPDKGLPRQLFADPVHPGGSNSQTDASGSSKGSNSQNDASGNSAGSRSQNDAPGNSAGSDQRAPSGPSGPNNSHSMNDNGGTDCNALKEMVRRLSFWITQITGAKDIGENPDNVSFPNERMFRDLARLKKEVEALQRNARSVMPRIQGETPRKFPHWRKMWKP